MLGLYEFGFIGLVFIIVFLILLPVIVTIVVGIHLANLLGFTGFGWWCFIILFYFIVSSVIGYVGA